MSLYGTNARPHILYCSGWQTHNIGDVAHTPGGLAILERYFPEATVTVLPFRPLADATKRLIRQRFPSVSIVDGGMAPDGSSIDPAAIAAFDQADFFLHGSGPATLAWPHMEAFHRRTGKPFGVYGVTYGLYGTPECETLNRAKFVYFRDSASLALARSAGVRAPVMEWSPDVAFGTTLRDDAGAAAFLRAHELEPKRFLCCISRLRNTPFWEMPGSTMPFDAGKHAQNEAMRDADHRPLREAIIAVVRQTGMKILLCPEDNTQMAVARQNILEQLPTDVRANVVWQDHFWAPDLAIGVYAQSAGLFGNDMHSPILCIGQGVPAIVCRWAEQSTKGIMWRDIGLGDWLFDLDQHDDVANVAPAVLAMARDPAGAAQKASAARALVHRRFTQTMDVVRKEVLKSSQTVKEQT